MDGSAESGVIRRVALSYAADLLAAITAVLVCGRVLSPWPLGVASASLVPEAVTDAIQRFTPFGLWQTYDDIVTDAIQTYIHTGASGPLPALWVAVKMVGALFLAIPQAVLTIYQQSVGIYTWGCIAAFLVMLAAFALSLSSGRPSPLRLMLSAVAAPALTSLLFWLAQQTLLDAVSTLDWFAHMVPWCLPCPVICTLWWMLFPRAPHGAAATLVLFVHQCWMTHVWRRRRIRSELVGSRPH